MFQPPTFAGPGLPAPKGPCHGIALLPRSILHGQRDTFQMDGIVGANYLSTQGIWTFDYPAQQLRHESASWRPARDAKQAPLGFGKLPSGVQRGFPRLTMKVDGEHIDMLLDTGATSQPTQATIAATGDGTVNDIGATSYITTAMFERWQQRHPDWPVIEQGDTLFGPTHAMRLIRVPFIEWAGTRMGPIWFTERPVAAFHTVMAAEMDRAPEGALGGNVFKHLTLTIDYPGHSAWVTCHDAAFCTSVSPH
ncbi:hypothetical protein ISN76_04750 [Dyella halodurans]|uniref:Peptidase A2 domain-containing protein n=1 Tax=Dyella halodurans TaxID=1920171 RepID=A0ABV9C1C8_9GAMM|nr:hypothetical protein [Dyella halodurans]